MASQLKMTLGLKPVSKPHKQTIKRTGDMKPLPLSDTQLDWALNTNLNWVLSIVQPSEVKAG